MRTARAPGNVTLGQLAAKTGVSESLMKRLSSGRAAPSRDLLGKIAATLGIRPADLTATCSPLDNDEDINPEWQEIAGNPAVTLMIDRLTVTAEAQCESRLDQCIADYRLETHSKYYKTCSRFPRGVYCAAQPRMDGRYFRVDGNPNSFAERSDYKLLLAHARLESSSVTRVDIAMDYPLPLSSFQPLQIRQKQLRCYDGLNGIETISIGARRGAKKFNFYDKRVESAAPFGDALCRPMTRVEAQLRYPGVSLLQLAELKNPFDAIKTISISNPDWPSLERVLAFYAQTFGMAALQNTMGKQDFEKYCGLLAGSIPPGLKSPFQIFEEQWPDAIAELMSAII